MTIQHHDDASLQRWGRNIGTIAPALEEIAREEQRREDEAAAALAVISKLAAQGENDQPASSAVTSEVESIQRDLANIVGDGRAAKIRKLAQRAEALNALYRREHETDEDRLDAPRKSRQAEKRSDVSSAEQDT